MIKKDLPEGIQFSFANLDSPDTIEIQVDLHVFMSDEQDFEGDSVLYRVVIEFGKDEVSNAYHYSRLELFDNHNIDPYDHKKLEKSLTGRLEEILEFCTLDLERPLKLQLNTFLAEYGGSDQRFLL